jgi:hypothetical protein
VSRRQLVFLLVKVVGFFILALALAGLPGDWLAFTTHLKILDGPGAPPQWSSIAFAAASSLLPFAIYLVAGLAMILLSNRIVGKDDTDGDRLLEAADFWMLEKILVGLIGVFFVADGAADIVRWTAFSASAIVVYDVPWGAIFSSGSVDIEVRGGVKLLVGLMLVVRRNGIAALRRRVDGWVRTWSGQAR